MTSLGERAATVRVRPATDDEAFLLGALHLQSLHRAGQAPKPGPPSHVQAFARSWQERSADLPAWVAEHAGEHVGMAICRVPLLPRLGRPVPELIAVLPLVGDPVTRPGDPQGGDPQGGDRQGGDRQGGDRSEMQTRSDAVCLALVRGVVTWSGAQGYGAVEVAPEVRLPAAVLDAARAVVVEHRRVSLPTRP